MELDQFIQISSFGIQTAILVSGPPLLFGLIAGVAISVFQAATQINDAALAFIPKIAAAVLSLLFFGTWMMSKIVTFTTYALNQIPMVTS